MQVLITIAGSTRVIRGLRFSVETPFPSVSNAKSPNNAAPAHAR
ncbi:hypothetical protein [Antrihabitans stalagmiti]|nr:hypothetical protein [Antrihabitans stalagmiti]